MQSSSSRLSSELLAWAELVLSRGWNGADWRFRRHRALRRHRLETVKEPIRSRDRRNLRAGSRLLSEKFCLEIFANSKSTQTTMSLFLPCLFYPLPCAFSTCKLSVLRPFWALALSSWPKKRSEIFIRTINCFPCCHLNGDVSTVWKSQHLVLQGDLS